jgi:hypothetical protein
MMDDGWMIFQVHIFLMMFVHVLHLNRSFWLKRGPGATNFWR